MSQHDFVVDNGPGLAVRQDINAAIQALVSVSSGPVEPLVKTPGMLWLDTSVAPNGVLRQRNLANNAWISMTISTTTPGQDMHAYPEKTVPSGLDEFVFSNSTSTPAPWQAAKMTFNNMLAAIASTLALDRIFSTPADMGLSFRAAGTPAGSLSRVVVNTKPDLSGTDVAVIDDAGKMALGQATIPSMDQSLIAASRITMQSGFAINAYVDPVGTPAWKATTTGWSLSFQIDKTTGAITLARGGSTAAGAAIATMPILLQFDPAGGAYFAGLIGFTNYLVSSTNVALLAATGAGTCYMRPNGVGSGTGQMYVDTGGNLVTAGNVSAYSDPRLKDDVEPITDALDIINALDGVRFTWNHRTKMIGRPGGRDIGVLSNQVEAVLPEIVGLSLPDEDNDNEQWKLVAYDKLTPVLIEAVKILAARVEALEARS